MRAIDTSRNGLASVGRFRQKCGLLLRLNSPLDSYGTDEVAASTENDVSSIE
jgi:hypothetical protein